MSYYFMRDAEETCVIRPFTPASFWTSAGAAKCAKKIEKKMPKLRNWRFVTLTIDPEIFDGEADRAFDSGRRQLRQMIYELRKKYDIRRYCWKLEIHSNGFPHWHMLIDYKRKIDAADIRNAWRLGRIDVQGVTESKFHYLMKYVTKCIDDLPQWVAERNQVRCWQTSRNFYFLGDGGSEKENNMASPRRGREEPASDTQNKKSSRKEETLGERLKRWSTAAVVHQISETSNDHWFLVQFNDKTGDGWNETLCSFAGRLCGASLDLREKHTIGRNHITTTKKWIQHLPLQQATL